MSCTRHPDSFDPDTNQCCKFAYWRKNGAFGVTYQGGRESFHDKPSVREQQKQLINEAHQLGHTEIERADRVWS